MSLRLKLTLLLSLIVGVTLFVAWGVTRRAVLTPFADEIMEAHVREVVYVAGELERGVDRKKLEQTLGLQIRRSEHPPPFVRRRGRHKCHESEVEGREIVACRGPRAPVAARSADGWVVVRRDLDPSRPLTRLGQFLLIIAIVVIALSAWVAVIVTRPLRTTVSAMERMAGGDLRHRLPAGGGRELAEVGRAFNAMADRVDQLLRAEKEMMAGLSHELRTPLARLRLQTELLRDDAVPPKRLDAMEADLEEMDRLIGELLELSRLSIGSVELNLETVDLRAVADEAVARTPLPKHRVQISGTSAPVRGARVLLIRLISNLLQNSGKYAPEGSQVMVRISEREVSIEDEGPGVAQEELPMLFEPFYRGERNRKGSATGYGLGLMIAKQVVTLHGGEIEAQNGESGGLVIRFRLPPSDGAHAALPGV